MKKLLIKNAFIVNADESFAADILLSDGKIEKIDHHIPGASADEIIDAAGKTIIPGGIDPHVHLDLPTPAGPSSDDFFTGSRAALAGGTTSLIDFVTPQKDEPLLHALRERKKVAFACRTNMSFHLGITSWNSTTAADMRRCVLDEGIVSFKTYLAYRETIGIDDDTLYKVLQTASALNAIVAVHCEDGEEIAVNQQKLALEGKLSPRYHAVSRPAEMEVEAIRKVIQLVEDTLCTVYIVHVSSGESVRLIADAQRRNLPVFAETCPHYLLFDDKVYQNSDQEALPFILSPPIRKLVDQDALWKGISENTLQVISTDHCPFNLLGQKNIGTQDFRKIPNGTGSIEHRLSLIYTYGVKERGISMNHFVGLVSEKAARIFRLSGQKGKIAEGMDADLVIWNTNENHVIRSADQFQHCDHTIYEGFTIHGRPETVFLGGKIVFG